MNQIIGFLRLQQIDSRLDQLNTRLNQIHNRLEDKRELEQITLQKKAIKEIIDSSAQQIENTEQKVLTLQIKIQQVESNLYSGKVTNPKELQDLQAEITSLKRQSLILENTQLQMMISLDADQKEYDLICKNFENAEQEFFTKNDFLIEERNTLLREADRLGAEKKAAENSISIQDLSYYNKLRLHRGGVAVSTISERACNSCGATLTPAQEQAVKSSEQMICCPSCGRMLYAT